MKRLCVILAAALLLFCTGCSAGEPERPPAGSLPGEASAAAAPAAPDSVGPAATGNTEAALPERSEPVMPESTETTENDENRNESDENTNGEETTMRMKVQVNDAVFYAVLEENEAVSALIEQMKDGPVTIRMSDYSGFEKVGPLGRSLPTSNSQTTTQAGDIVLYNGDQIVIFYGSNSWSYTRLGHIEDLSGWAQALGSGDVTVTFSWEG